MLSEKDTSRPRCTNQSARPWYDKRDAAPADVQYDSAYESPACREDRGYWHHNSRAGTVTRFHIVERRARFDPTSVKGCPAEPSLLSDARITNAMTDGTEFLACSSICLMILSSVVQGAILLGDGSLWRPRSSWNHPRASHQAILGL